MSIGQREKATQKRVIKLFVQNLGTPIWVISPSEKNANIETELLTKFLTRKGLFAGTYQPRLEGAARCRRRSVSEPL